MTSNQFPQAPTRTPGAAADRNPATPGAQSTVTSLRRDAARKNGRAITASPKWWVSMTRTLGRLPGGSKECGIVGEMLIVRQKLPDPRIYSRQTLRFLLRVFPRPSGIISAFLHCSGMGSNVAPAKAIYYLVTF